MPKDKECLNMIEKQLGKEPKKKENWFKDIKEKNTLLFGTEEKEKVQTSKK
jgi:hypothetical protein